MFAAAGAAMRQIFSPPFRAVLARSLSLTIAALALVWLARRQPVAAAAAPSGA